MYRHTLYKIIAVVEFITAIIFIVILSSSIRQHNININEGPWIEHTHGSHNDDFQYEHAHRMHGPHNHP